MRLFHSAGMRIKLRTVKNKLAVCVVVRTPERMARPRAKREKEPTNLSLSKEVKQAAIEIASTRYGISLTELVERLLERELAQKRGGAHVTVKIGEAVA